MWRDLKKRWKELAADEPGQRFQNRYQRIQQQGHKGLRVVWMILGIVFLIGGVILLLIPGPGSVLLVIGAAFLSQTSESAAKLLDRIELKLRKIGKWALDRWRRAGMVARSLLVFSTAAIAVAAAWFVYSYFWR